MSHERGNRALKFIDFWLGIPLTVPAAIWRKLTARPGSLRQRPKICIFCPGAAGDVLLLSGLTGALRDRFPQAQIELLGSSANAGVLPLNPHANSISAWPLRRLDKFLAYIRRNKYDVFIDCCQWARVGNLLANLSGAKITIGFATRRQWRSLGYDRLCLHSRNCHEAENFLNLGRSLWPELAGKPEIRLPVQRVTQRKGFFCHFWPAPGKNRYLKEWPSELWAEVIDRLVATGDTIYLTGSYNDARPNQEFLNRYFPDNKRVGSIAGKTAWTELANLFFKAKAVISVNTGVLHLAALTGTPTIGLHGATNPLRWGPVGPHVISLLPDRGEFAYLNLGFEYPRNAQPAMQHISVNAVLAALDKLGVPL